MATSKGKETVIKTVKWHKEIDTKFGVMQQFVCTYDDKTASFLCKNKDKPTFEAGKKYMFTESEREYKGKTYYNIKAVKQNTGYNKSVKREQSKYSGFSTSYVKDMIIAGQIKIEPVKDEHPNETIVNVWKAISEEIFTHMVELDKTLEND